MLTRRRALWAALAALFLVACQLVPRHPGPPPRAPAPAFSLPSHQGTTVSLGEMLRRGPAVVVFYRGFW